MKRILSILSVSLLFVNFVGALPPLQHFVQGTIVSIGKAEIELATTDAAKDTPTRFTIKEGRTRFRENGKKVWVKNLKVGQFVRVYYRNERGEWLATEVSWKVTPSQ